MPLSSNQFTNLNLTQIAAKRLSGKAQTNSNFSIANEGYGSTVQTLAQTVFAEIVPNSPDPTWNDSKFIIQSSSEGSPGTVQLVEFELEAFGTPYINSTDNDAGDSSDQGTSGGVSTYHSYAIKLTGSYESETNNNLDTDASTESTLGTGVFQNSYFMSGSGGRLQIVPEYASSLVSTGNPTTGNPYTPYLIAANGNQITIGSDIDWYLDTYSGILFVQDPVDFTSGLASSRPNKIRCFIYTGKYQDQATFGSGDVNFIVSGSDEGFAVANDDTINFVSGSAGITVVNDGTDTITIGAETDNITVNQITASIINADKIEASEYIVSSSITYMTQSFSSGSTIFGDTLDDTHQFTGSLYITSALNTGNSGSIIANSWISASDLYLTDTLTALDGGVTVTSNDSPELYVAGNITASGDISASGLLFASASDDGGSVGSIAVAMYDTASGRLYYTSSNALGDTTLLEASASAGIFFSASEGTGFSIGLMQSASFTSGSGDGLTVEAGVGTNNIEFTLVGVLSSSQQIATDISGAIDAATGSLLTDYDLLSGSAQIATEISGAIGAATASLSASIVGTANEVEVIGTLGGTIQIGLPDDVTIAGDLTVNGTTTSVNTDNLYVEDQFILLNSGAADNSADIGIIAQTSSVQDQGSALYWDAGNARWEIDHAGADASGNTAVGDAAIVTIKAANNATPSDPYMGAVDAGIGQMYIDTGDNDSDGNTIYIYA